MRKFIQILIGVYLSSPNPKMADKRNYFMGFEIGKAARERKEAKEGLANKFYDRADEIDDDISEEQSKNPFESAAAKSAMKRTSRGAKQYEQRTANQLGAGASAEALISAQGKGSEAIGEAAGNIATGAEAQKQTNIANLNNRKSGLLGTAAGFESGAIDEIGQGWKDFFGYVESVGKLAGGVGSVASVL